MKINNTIFQTESFQTSSNKINLDDNEIFYRVNNDSVIIDASLIPIIEYSKLVVNYFFKEFPNAKYIKFVRAAETKNDTLFSKQIKIKHFDNNYCLLLPVSIDEYRLSLGKKTRMHLGQYLRRIEKELCKYGGGYFMESFSPDNKYIFDRINELNRERCHSKGFETGGYNLTLWDKLKDKGVLNYLKIGDDVIAGTIGSIYNNQFCLFAIAHSNAYGKLNPGNAILYKTIENSIKQGLYDFNFLWGDCEYKIRFGAREIKLYDYYIYRTYLNYFFKQCKVIVEKIVKKSKSLIKSILRHLYHFAKWLYHHTLKRSPKSLGYILMLHRVDEFEEGHLWCNEHMKVTPDFLDKTIYELKEKYDIIPLKKVPERLKQKSKRKFVAFTMDDGYKDNFTKALPVFRKHNVPYTIFVTTAFPDRKAILWWYELEDLLLQNESVTLANGVTYPAHNYEEKCNSFLKIREEILKLNQLDLENELNKLFEFYKINWTAQCEKLCLSWDDIRELKKDPLVTIGAHTKHHYNLKQLATEEDVKNEVQAGIDLLMQNAGIEPFVFAYPFGSPTEAAEREYKVLSALPFTCSCMAYGGSCTNQNSKNLSSLPRIMFKQDFKLKDLK